MTEEFDEKEEEEEEEFGSLIGERVILFHGRDHGDCEAMDDEV